MKIRTLGPLVQVWFLAIIVVAVIAPSRSTLLVTAQPDTWDSQHSSSKVRKSRNRNIRNLRKTKECSGPSPAATNKKGDKKNGKGSKKNPPNVLVFIVDDLGWNQVGYHARNVGNFEVQTPNIDNYATQGIEMDRGYMTPWCGPSRAALQTGRTNSFNANISNDEWIHARFDDDIGVVGGLQPGTQTIATAFKEYGKKSGRPYKTYYAGKWGIGGSTWTNTPHGMGYDTFRGFWGDSLESCDGWHPWDAVPPYLPSPTDTAFGPTLRSTLPGYWEQSQSLPNSTWCERIQAIGDLSSNEKNIACKSAARTLPKLMDLDLLDYVVNNIETHDYSQGPFLQVFATQMMHLPMQYPQEYDEGTVFEKPHFAASANKPPATNTDLRLTTRNAMRFIDDIFDETMQAIKDAGQWDNTIVLFTSDNGGATYQGTANNNYPLRGAKFTVFEGGLRVTQFLTGGWIDKQLPPDRRYKSGTYVFPNDWGPTLLEMAGGSSNYLLGQNAGASGPYGSEMWSYIKRSVLSVSSGPNASTQNGIQRTRQVSYAPNLFFSVMEEKTFKYAYFGDGFTISPRHWAPVWPKDNDLLFDTGYRTVRPCRFNNGTIAKTCCYFDIQNDPREFQPIDINCDNKLLEAQNLFVIDGGCPTGKEPMCLGSNSSIPTGNPPNETTIWSHYGAVGPMINAKTFAPIYQGFPMKCVCQNIHVNATQAKVDSFTATAFSPGECFDSSTLSQKRGVSIDCQKGSFVQTPQRGMLESFAGQGYNLTSWGKIILAEQNKLFLFTLPELMITILAFSLRTGFTEWPNVAKFPYNAFGLDTCRTKGATVVPIPPESLAPYYFSVGNPTAPSNSGSLCFAFNPSNVQKGYFCPAKQNPLFEPVKAWVYDSESARGLFANGSIWHGISLGDCATFCSTAPAGSAYIGPNEENWGLRVS